MIISSIYRQLDKYTTLQQSKQNITEVEHHDSEQVEQHHQLGGAEQSQEADQVRQVEFKGEEISINSDSKIQ